MAIDHREKLAGIKTFNQLVTYLRDEMNWPIVKENFEDLTFEYTVEELGIDSGNAAKIRNIKRLRPLSVQQPWGIFFVEFEPKRLPVVALRRILGQVALKRRASANSAERSAWAMNDLLFISNYGEGDTRQISFAHFAKPQDDHDLPTLKVLGWDNLDTALHLDAVAKELTEHLAWPDDTANVEAWRQQWSSAFTLHNREVITTSKELSIRLDKLAGDIRDRIKSALAIETDRGSLTKLMKAFQTSLVHDLDADGFADMYAQTIAYGLLSARIADPTKKTVDDFAGHMRTNPFLRELMETFLKVGGRRGKAGGPGIDFDELGVSEVVQLLDDANMEAVVLDFGDKNPQEDPVIHFYELFLKEYDARKRMQRGVFYTPRPVVSYIVRSVDELLRTEFGLEDGLADTTTWGEMTKRNKDLKIPEGILPEQGFVQILDPATGTGTFLVEVIDIIHKTMVAKWKAQGHGEKKIASLWNEYVPKHLLTRLHAYELLMAPYAIAHLKVGLKLYETGYRFGSDERARIYLTNALEPAHDFSGTFEFAIPALAHEAQAVNEIKRKQRFTVVVGNPPYSNFGRANEGDWIKNLVLDFWGSLKGESKVNLYDDYIKFLRLAFYERERSGVAVIGMITNRSFLDGATQRQMRAFLLSKAQTVRVVDLYRGIYDPEGAKDENVFAITTGVSITIWCCTSRAQDPRVYFGRLVGTFASKAALLTSPLSKRLASERIVPKEPDYLLIPQAITRAEYGAGVPVPELFRESTTGVQTNRDALCLDDSADALMDRIKAFSSSAEGARRTAKSLGLPTTSFWDPATASAALRSRGVARSSVFPYLYRPFELKWIYYDNSVVHCPRDLVAKAVLGRDTLCLLVSRGVDDPGKGVAFITKFSADKRALNSARGEAKVFPFVKGQREQLDLGSESVGGNLSGTAMRIARQGELSDRQLFDMVYAILSSTSYLDRNDERLRLDYPRIPIPQDSRLALQLAALGGELVQLHLMESAKVGHFITKYEGPKNPEVVRVDWSDDTVWLDAAATKKSQPASPGTIGFKGVPEAVWNFHIGGYQVCEKWLKDRKGRKLSAEDIRHYQRVIVALSETIRLMQEIDAVIEQHGGWPGAFQTREAQAVAPKVIPFRPRIVQPGPKERYVTCVPLVPLKVAAGAFSDPQHIDDDGFEWTAVETRRRLRPGMFVAQVVGKSMEPAIPDGAYCLFAAPVEGTRQGKTVLVQLRDATDPESGERYTVKRYESQKAQAGDSWRHEKITLKPVNPDFKPIVLTCADEGELQVIAEFVEVLSP